MHQAFKVKKDTLTHLTLKINYTKIDQYTKLKHHNYRTISINTSIFVFWLFQYLSLKSKKYSKCPLQSHSPASDGLF